MLVNLSAVRIMALYLSNKRAVTNRKTMGKEVRMKIIPRVCSVFGKPSNLNTKIKLQTIRIIKATMVPKELAFSMVMIAYFSDSNR